MIVAMPIVLMVQMPINQVINVVTVRNRFVATPWTMNVCRIVAAACMAVRAADWVCGCHLKSVLFDDTRSRLMVQMPIVQEVNMVAMLDRCMPAVCSMDMAMIFVLMTHFLFFPFEIVIREYTFASQALRHELNHWQSNVQYGCPLTGNRCASPAVASRRCALPAAV